MDNILQHFQPNEQKFIEIINNKIKQVENTNKVYLTNFFNPRERHILKTIIKTNLNVDMISNGGFLNSEMAKCLIYPKYYKPNINDFELKAIELTYSNKFYDIKHSSILGSLIHSGLKRNSFGDIVKINKNTWQIITTNNIYEYIKMYITSINKIKINITEITLDGLYEKIEELDTIEMYVNSIRLDSILSNYFKISRVESKKNILNNKVKINWTIVNKPDIDINIDDLISLRQYGRLKIIDKINKKNKWILVIQSIKK